MNTNLFSHGFGNILNSNLGINLANQLNNFIQTQNVKVNQIWIPSLEVYETEEVFLVQLSVPGVEAENIDIDFLNNFLTVSGESFPPKILHEDNTIQKIREITYGKFSRKIILPYSVSKEDSITINLDRGFLQISIDKN